MEAPIRADKHDMDEYHQKLSISLKSKHNRQRGDLHKLLLGLGFESIDDFYHLGRQGSAIPIWQSKTLLTIWVRLNGAEVYKTEEEILEGEGGLWDELIAEYLLATLPRECIRPAVELIFLIADELGLEVIFQGRTSTKVELHAKFAQIADELKEGIDEPGSESLAILIKLKYQKP